MISTELLVCMRVISLRDLFSTVNKEKIYCLAQLYCTDFSPIDLLVLENQLENYILDKLVFNEYSDIYGIAKLTQKLVKRKFFYLDIH